jgi:drug/metabolite transporter (DMT)-like permease
LHRNDRGAAVARAGVGRTATLMYPVPVIGALTPRVLFGEDFDAHKIAGAMLILCGLGLARRPAGTARTLPSVDLVAEAR